MSYRVRERIIFDVVDESNEDVVTTAVERETAESVTERLNAGNLQHTRLVPEDKLDVDVGRAGIT